MPRLAAIALLWLAFHGRTDAASANLLALIDSHSVAEISGLAASPRFPDVYWLLNDGSEGKLYAIDRQGKLLSTLRVDPLHAIDWEDLAIAELDGAPTLLIADTGDNGGLRGEVSVLAVREPERLDPQITARPLWQQRFRWPDGPRDCEAMAWDAASQSALFISKKRVPAELFRLPLADHNDRVVTVERIATLFGIQQPTAEDISRNPMYGRYRAQITGADISPDGQSLAVLTYRQAVIYRRNTGEGWDQAVAREPVELPFPWLPQAEAIGFDHRRNSVLISSERVPAPLIEVSVK